MGSSSEYECSVVLGSALCTRIVMSGVCLCDISGLSGEKRVVRDMRVSAHVFSSASPLPLRWSVRKLVIAPLDQSTACTYSKSFAIAAMSCNSLYHTWTATGCVVTVD